MITGAERVGDRAEVESRVQALLESLGEGRVDGVAYDTAWSARLGSRYPGHGFEQNMEWLRRNQYVDGTWGGSLVHYHDRFVSTLAAIVALQEGILEGRGQPRDARRVKRGEDALWKVVGKLGRDDSDTVGFPILATSLAEEATELGLEVPNPPIRYAEGYRRKVNALLAQPQRDWRETTLVFSLEALRTAILPDDLIIEKNHSVAVSPSATAGYLLIRSQFFALPRARPPGRRHISNARPRANRYFRNCLVAASSGNRRRNLTRRSARQARTRNTLGYLVSSSGGRYGIAFPGG